MMNDTPMPIDAIETQDALAEPSWLDRSLATLFTWNGERIAWLVLLAVALAIRLVDLGARTASHDESEHAWFAYNLFAGKGYEHSPVYHGPFIYHVMALFYLIFGDSDVTARVPTALFGFGIVALMWPARRWLGKYGAYFAALLLTFSPALLHYSRHTRHDIYEIFWAMVFILCAFRYLEATDQRPAKWLYLVAAGLSLALASKEDAFIHGALLGGFLVLFIAYRWIFWRLNPNHPAEEREAPLAGATRRDWAMLAGIFALALLGAVFVRMTGLSSGGFDATGLAGTIQTVLRLLPMIVPPVAAIGLAVWYIRKRESETETPLAFSTATDVTVLLATLILPWVSPLFIRLLGYDPLDYNFPTGILSSLSVVLAISGAAIAVGVLWNRRRWLIAAGIFYAIFIILFTAFFTNGKGWATGLVGSLGYWLSQQGVARGSQPWYYYALITPLYEFLPILLTIPVLYRAFVRRNATSLVLLFLAAAFAVGAIIANSALVNDPAAADSSLSGLHKLLAHAAVVVAIVAAAWGGLTRFPGRHNAFLAFLPMFVVGSWGIYSWAGEKMPWLVASITLPMCIAGGWWLGQVVERVDWQAVRAKGGIWIAVLVLPLLAAIRALLRSQPFQDRSIAGLSETSQWLGAVVIAIITLGLIIWLGRRLGWVDTRRVIGLTLTALLALWMLRTTYLLNFVNYDYTSEFLFYAHASPDPKMVMNNLEEMSRRTVGDKQLKIAYDDDSSWPFNWYLRDWPNAVYFGANPTREAMQDAPAVLVGDKNLDKARPYLQRDYYEFRHRLIWWPDEGYRNTTWDKIKTGITDPAKRKEFLDVVLSRKYPTPLSEWPLVHRFSLFVRKDVASQLWDFGAQPAAAPALVDPYEQGMRDVASQQIIGSGPGTAPGLLNFPRNVAVAADGAVLVADSGNHRIQTFAPDGSLVNQWGSSCELYTEGLPGCIDPDGAGPLELGDGQMREPWGIAVGPQGNIYVADTWNHRVLVFDAAGNQLAKWGAFATTNGEAVGSPSGFWGPRGIAVDSAGNVYVADTGNKRIQVFDAGGAFLGQFGGGGAVEGRFDEPVGLALVPRGSGEPGGALFVADTWNRRVQKFDVAFAEFAEGVPSFTFAKEWPIEGWSSQSVVNKPFLATDGGRVYVTDPESWRVLVFDTDGNFKATFGVYGTDAKSFALPVGIAVGPDSNVYVADSDNHRVMAFPPID
jgi:predicted membrane-bound mannosyltransferase/DNA-binding beta-propeller fold protein YncE